MRSSGGFELNANVAIASSLEFMYGSIALTCALTKKLIVCPFGSEKKNRKLTGVFTFCMAAYAPPFVPMIMRAMLSDEEFIMHGHCPLLHFIYTCRGSRFSAFMVSLENIISVFRYES